MNVAVYCSARQGLLPEVIDDASRLGQWIGQHRHTLVYGGLTLGLMGVVASAVAENGGHVMGIVPQSRMQFQHPDNNVNIHVATLHERKQIMEENADAFVALDGGFGTLDEVMSALASGTFFNEPKPIFLLNRNGLYDPLKAMLTEMSHRHLAHPDVVERLHLCSDMDALIRELDNTASQK